jgi:hypothetical protein
MPFIKTGGLADVAGALPVALNQEGLDVRVILPKYRLIPYTYICSMEHVVDFTVLMGSDRVYCGIDTIVENGVRYYFVDNLALFGGDRVYTGDTVKLNGLVTFHSWILRKGIHYTTTCNREPKEIGKVTVTVTGKGNFTGSAKVTFNIIPKDTRFTELEGGKSWIKLKWQKQENITGYQIQYSLKSNFTDAEKVNIKKAKIVEKTIRGLKGKTTYYVRIRTYKKVGKKVYYSAWSNAKTVRTEAGKTNNEPDIQDSDATLNVDGTLDLGLLDIPGDLALPDDVELPGEMELEIAG